VRHLLSAAVVFVMLGASTCATTSEPRIEVREIRVPIQVPCPVKEPPEPAYVDTKEAVLAAPDIFAKVQLLLAGRLQRIAYSAQQRAAFKACASP
jgi:hypothetical protein